jgi:hypothetical protein
MIKVPVLRPRLERTSGPARKERGLSIIRKGASRLGTKAGKQILRGFYPNDHSAS